MTVSPVKLLEGKSLTGPIQDEIKSFVESCRAAGREVPGLRVLQANQDPSSSWYIGQQEKLAAKLGLHFEKIGPEKIRHQEDLLRCLAESGDAARFHGLFLAMPFPAGFDAERILLALDPKKDVEGVHPASLGLMVLRKARLVPPTAFAAYRLIQASGISLKGKRAAIVGQSAIVGRPLQLLLGDERVTTTVCNSATSAADLEKIISESDIVVGCCGQPRLIRGSWIKPGAVVIDVGTTEVDGKLVGDIEFDAASERASFITPVPGGVGPLTVTMLMSNLVQAYRWQKGL
ncbi:MAG: bifunctional 5,10-methylenetetrahydrofolate dehydrogenase/5,10-methenyltetrahydrofolate cyclohydrolase [Candidatus Omnitrophica bacterium]|nr:bifunctional 5,10-methylenetetrahydrofolate dehydrogenase/5,10-methenyltetrahydrofolate cyclohydrolase [Candidatus Omnitrophota bacterium]